jgi:hydrophobe/amphiphile efflux-3 (HAE3) family protein
MSAKWRKPPPLPRLIPRSVWPKLTEGVLRHRFPILITLILLFAASVYGIFQLRADFSFETIFLSEDKEARFFDEFKERFEESSRDIVVMIQGDGLYQREGMGRVLALTEKVEEVDGIEKVVNVFNTPSIQGTEDGVIIEPLAEELPDTETEAEAIRDKALDNRLFHRMFTSEDGNTLALLARLAPDIQTEKQKRPIIDTIQDLSRQMMGDRYSLFFSGIPTIQKEYTEQGLGDMRKFFALSAAIVCFFLYVTFRNMAGLYLPQATVITSVVLLLGLMSLCHQKINLINNVIPSLLLVYGIADSIHLLHRYYEELGKGLGKREALLVTIRHMALACFMTSITTAVGFFSLTTATIHIIKTFGLFAGMGIIIAYLVTILLLPILLSLHPKPKRRGKIRKGQGLLERILMFMGRLNERHPKKLLASGMILFALSAYFCTQVNIESYILEELTEDNPIVLSNQVMEDEMMGVFPYQIQVSAGEEGEALDPDFLRRVDELERFIASQPWILKTLSVVDILKEMNQAMHGGDPAFYRVPSSRELVAQYLLLYGMSGNQEDLDVLLTPDNTFLQISCSGKDMGTHNYFTLKQRTEEKAADLFSPPWDVHVTGRSLLAQNALGNVIRDMLVSIFTAFGVICITVSILYRSLRVGLISMVPNIIPLVFTMGFMGFFGMTLRTSTVIIFAISLGIAVDDTIHYITRFREELVRRGDYVASMYHTLRSAGRAIVLTTFIMIAGFLVLLVSQFRATQDFGLLASITIAAALLGSLLFLPAALNLLKPWKVEAGPGSPEGKPAAGRLKADGTGKE